MKLVQQVTVEFLETFSPNHSLVSLFWDLVSFLFKKFSCKYKLLFDFKKKKKRKFIDREISSKTDIDYTLSYHCAG